MQSAQRLGAEAMAVEQMWRRMVVDMRVAIALGAALNRGEIEDRLTAHFTSCDKRHHPSCLNCPS